MRDTDLLNQVIKIVQWTALQLHVTFCIQKFKAQLQRIDNLSNVKPLPTNKKPQQTICFLRFYSSDADGTRTRNHRIDSPVL